MSSTHENTHTSTLIRTIGMQLSVKELAWLAELPFYIRSVDLGCVFVHAGFKAGESYLSVLSDKPYLPSIHLYVSSSLLLLSVGKKLNEQDPWVMMTVRSLLPDGRMSPRCFNRLGRSNHGIESFLTTRLDLRNIFFLLIFV